MNERPAGDDEPPIALSATEKHLRAYIRAGLVDAEIAVRMGVSNGDVKARVERLVAKLGVEGREGLRGRRVASESRALGSAVAETSPPPSHEQVPRRAIGILGGIAFAFVVGLGAGWLVGDRSEPRAGATIPAEAEQTPVSPTPTPEVERFQEFNGLRMEYAGTLLASSLSPFIVADSSDREGLSAIWLSAPGFIGLGTDVVEWKQVEDGSILAGLLGERRFELHLFPGQGTQVLGGDGEIAIYTTSTTRERPLLLLFAVGPDGGRHPLHIDYRGRLYIASSPLSPSTVLESQTGEALQMTSLIPLSKLPEAVRLTTCRDREACTVSHYATRDLAAPFSGRVTCPDTTFVPPADTGRDPGDQVLTLSNETVSLSFWRVVMTSPDGPAPSSICSGRETAIAGEELLPAGQYIISARSADGTPLDVGVALDGTLSVGEVEPKVGCPCLGTT